MSDLASAVPIVRHRSVVHALEHHSAADATARITVEAPPQHALDTTHGGLLDSARRGAAALAAWGVGAGDRVMLAMPTSAQAIVAFTGVLVLGAIPVPVAPLLGARRASLPDRIRSLVAYVEPRAVIADQATFAELGPAKVIRVDLDELYRHAIDPGNVKSRIRFPEADDCALIQCTSGSTGSPKGVVVTHANLAANVEQIAGAAGWTADDVWAGWLPLYHDMGLIGGLMTSLYIGSSTALITPARFLRTPTDWLSLVHRHRATVSASTNFGLGYVARRVRGVDVDGFDLSSWRTIFCGAEQVNRSTAVRFVDLLGDGGLPPNAVLPCYGLAEATLIVTSADRGAPVSGDVVSRQQLTHEAVAVDADPSSSDAMEIVDVGRPVTGTEVQIVDHHGSRLPDDHVGAVRFRGPSRTVGYYGLPAETGSHVDSEGWWRTGDVGYLRDGSLRITGRESEVIVIRGANYSPVDFERLAEAVEGVAPGAVAAVGHRDGHADSDELCLVVEIATAAPSDGLAVSITSAVTGRTGVAVSRIRFVPRGAIPKTTSGKMQRAVARRIFFGDATTG